MIKVEVKKDSVKKNDYPKIMVSEAGNVVLFLKESYGFILSSERNDYKTGHHDDDWDMSRFTDFHGTITLSNGENQ